MLNISINGGRWYGDAAPQGIESLIELLQTETLDPNFERFYKDRFMSDVVDEDGQPTDCIRFWGGFADKPHLFDLRTDEKPVINQLKRLIQKNLSSDAYAQARRAVGIR